MKKFNGNKSRLLVAIGLMFAVLIISDSCTKSSMDSYTGTGTGTGSKGTVTPGANEVWIQSMAFTPASITVTAGTTITWTNNDPVTHDVTSTTSQFNSGAMGPGATFSFKFSTAGTYSYICSIHPNMTGTVVVN
jgi:plastocyanin